MKLEIRFREFCLRVLVLIILPSTSRSPRQLLSLRFKYKMFVYYEIKRDCKRTKYNPSLDKIQEYRRNWLQHTNRITLITENIKKLRPAGARNQGRPFKRL